MPYCYLINVVCFIICTLKNCKNKRIFVSNKNVLPGDEATGPVDRHHGHGTKYVTRYTFGIVRSASNKIDKLAACCKIRSFEYREKCIDGLTETWPQHKNDDSTVNLESEGRIQFLMLIFYRII